MIKFLVAFTLLPFFLTAENNELSQHIGYMIWRDYLSTLQIHYDLEQVLEGMKAAKDGKTPEGTREEFQSLLQKAQIEIAEKVAEQNLQEAQTFLAHLASSQNIVEVSPGKVYFTTLVPSNREPIGKQASLKFNFYQLHNGSLQLEDQTGEQAVCVHDEDLLEGLRLGLLGMRVGEKRIIYIHPDFAFGQGKLSIGPNKLVAFEIAALSG